MTVDLATLDTDITSALAELRAARTIADHSPSEDNRRTVALCDQRLDKLLAQRPHP